MSKVIAFPTKATARRLARERELQIRHVSAIDVVKSGRANYLFRKYGRNPNLTFKE